MKIVCFGDSLPGFQTILDLWREAVELAPEKIAVVDGERRLSYAEADALIKRLAAGICRAAGNARPKVAIFLPNCLEYYLIYWAVAYLGGTAVPLNTWLKKEALSSIFRNVQPDLLVVRSPDDSLPIAALEGTQPTAIAALEGGSGDIECYSDLIESSEPVPCVNIKTDDLAIIMHTSGTTGEPKGAMMRHTDLMFNVMTAINAHQFSPHDVHLLVNPMFHCTPLYSLLPAAAYQKSAIVITANTSPGQLMDLIQKEQITTFLSTPSVLRPVATLANLHEYDHSSLRLIAYAGSPMPISTIRQLQKHFPDVALHNFFGMTETISMTHVLTGEEAGERPDSIGRLLPFVEAKIVDENGTELPSGQEGELLFARENVISGYYNDDRKILAVIRTASGREWFCTGDFATIDEEGFFFIKGRKKDMIIVGGENVFASEVEAALMEHEKVRDAAVKGVPATGVRSSLGELVKAYVVPEDTSLTEKDIKKHCHERLASYMIPSFVVFLDRLPRSPAGKIVKSELPQ